MGYVAWGAMARWHRRITCSDQVARRSCLPVTRATPAGPGRSSSAHVAAGRRVHGGALPDVRRLQRAFGLLASAIAVTAFRRGERWAWWALLVGNTIALVSAMTYDWTVERHRAVRADGIPRPRHGLGRARRHSSIPRGGTASSSDGVISAAHPGKRTSRWNHFTLPI